MTNSLQCFLRLGLLLTICNLGAVFAEGVKGRPIEYSQPRSEQGDSGNNLLPPGQTRLGQMESELNRPFLGLTPGKSLDGMILPPAPMIPPPAVTSPRARKLSNDKTDWMFLSPEEMYSARSLEDKYKVPELTPDGRNRNDLRPMERAYLNVVNAARSAMGTNQGFTIPGSSVDTGTGRFLPGAGSGMMGNSFPGSLNESGNVLPSDLSWSTGPAGLKTQDATDFFKFNNGYKPAAQPSVAELRRAEEFKQIYDFSNTQPETTDFSGGHMFASPYVDQSFFNPPKPVAAPEATLGGGLNGSSIGSGSSPSWAPAVAPPAPEPVRSMLAPSSPFINIPRRN